MEDGTLVEAGEGGQRCPPHGWLLKIVGMSHRADRARWYSKEEGAQKALTEFRPASHGTQRESARVVRVVPSAVPGMGRAAFALALAVALAVLPAPALAWGEQSPRVLTFQAWDFQGRIMMDERRELGSMSACEREAGALVEHARQQGYSFTWRCDFPESLSADHNWPDSWNHPGQPAEACKRPGGEGLVPCCNDVAGYTGECGIERPPAPTMPKVPVERGGDTAGLKHL